MSQSNPSGRTGDLFTLVEGALEGSSSYMAFIEQARKILFAQATTLGVLAGEAEARFLTVNSGLLLPPGISARVRAKMIAKPLEGASDALTVASKYILTSGNRFQAGFAAELEAAGSKRKTTAFKIDG